MSKKNDRQGECLTVETDLQEPYQSSKLDLVLIGTLVLGYLATYGLDALGELLGNSTMRNTAEWIFKAALLNKEVFDGQVWRLFTAAWLHGGFVHLFCNSLALAVCCMFLQTIFVGRSWLWIFLSSSVVGAGMTLCFKPDESSVGASIGIAGMVGAMLTAELLRRGERLPRSEYPAMVVPTLKGLLLAIAFQAGIEFLLPHVGHTAHLCGLVVGMVMGLVFARNGKYLIVTSNAAQISINYPEPVKTRFTVSSYKSVEFIIGRGFNLDKDFVGLVATTRGGLLKCPAQLEVVFGTAPATAGSVPYHTLGTQYPPLEQARVIDQKHDEAERAAKKRDYPWKVASIVIALIAAYFLNDALSQSLTLDVSGFTALQSLPDWLQTPASYTLSHAGCAIVSFMMAHLNIRVVLLFIQGLVQGGNKN